MENRQSWCLVLLTGVPSLLYVLQVSIANEIYFCVIKENEYIYIFFLLNWVQRGMFCLDHVKFWHALASPSQKNVRFESALFSLEKGEGYLAYLMLSHTLKSFFFFFFPAPLSSFCTQSSSSHVPCLQ